ncbi:MAG: iron ABC transporter substrate-binding protein, partial [Prevotella sp.]|nr:iron ABC transporter substrate-binding protein [Prevotella sp.]
MRRIMLIFACALLVCGCRQAANKGGEWQDNGSDTAKVVLKYAKGFAVEYRDGYRLVTIADPQKDDAKEYRFALVPRGEKPVGLPEGCTVIETPVRGVICMTALQLSSFIKL